MSAGWKLPMGRKPLPAIARLTDPADQVINLVMLLECLLSGPIGAKKPRQPGEPKDERSLGEIVSEHIAKFTVDDPDLQFAIRVRNALTHADAGRSFLPVDVRRAAGYLTQAVHDLMDHVDEDARAAVLSDPLGTRATPPLREIEKITHPCARLFALRERLEALLIARDADEGRWSYELANGEQNVTLQHRIDQHLSDLAEISPQRLQAALNTCAELESQSASDRASRPMRDYFDAIADLTHAVRLLEPPEIPEPVQAPSSRPLAPQPRPRSRTGLLVTAAVGALVILVIGSQWRSLVSNRKSASTAPPPVAPVSTAAARAAIDELRPLLKTVGDARAAFYSKNDHARRLAIPEFENRWREMERRNPPVTAETLRSFHVRLDQLELTGSQPAAQTQLRQLERQIADTKASLAAFNENELRSLAALNRSLRNSL